MRKELVKRFMELFRGYEHAHGRHTLLQPEEDGKVPGRAKTLGAPATETEFTEHLTGSGPSLGIIPICEDNNCWWGALDIDIRGNAKLRETHQELEKKMRGLGLPGVICMSKSRGAHIYFFFKEPIEAKLVQAKLADFAAALGYGGTEVFPKQVMRASKSDVGNWINLCYYNADVEHRTAIWHGEELDLIGFLDVAEKSAITREALQALRIEKSTDFEDGPPCLQQLATLGFEQGMRNNALMNISVYLKKKYPDDWQDQITRYNLELINPPLPNAEVQQLVRSAARKDYCYTCKQSPIANYCNKRLCNRREFGISIASDSGGGIPIDSLTKCVSKDSVRWFAEHQGERMELTTDQLLSPEQIQKIFLERFSAIINTGKRDKWHAKLKELLTSVEVIEDPEDASRRGQFEKLLESFLTTTRPARNKDEIIKGNCFLEKGLIHFRSEDLFTYLTIRRFIHNTHEVWGWIRSIGGDSTQVYVMGKYVRVWTMPEPEKHTEDEIALPETLEGDL
jgi:hypothetical protein